MSSNDEVDVGVVVATCRPGGVLRPMQALQLQKNVKWKFYAVLDGPAKVDTSTVQAAGHTVVDYEGPPYYSEEMALNAGGDLAAKNHPFILFMADLTEIGDDEALQRMGIYLRKKNCHLLSGVALRELSDGTVLQDPGFHVLKWHCPPPNDLGGIPVEATKHLVFFILTMMTSESWVKLNGFDERFAGANGYIDTNIARRMERTFGPCHIHPGLIGLRTDYRTKNFPAPKQKIYTPERNKMLDLELARKEILFGQTVAKRLYVGPNTPVPSFDGE